MPACFDFNIYFVNIDFFCQHLFLCVKNILAMLIQYAQISTHTRHTRDQINKTRAKSLRYEPSGKRDSNIKNILSNWSLFHRNVINMRKKNTSTILIMKLDFAEVSVISYNMFWTNFEGFRFTFSMTTNSFFL